MARCDYFGCAVCDGKAFYDANTDWDYQNCSIDDVRALCHECAKTHELKVVARDSSAPAQQGEQPKAQPSSAEADELRRAVAGRYLYLKAKHGVGDKRTVEFSQMLDQFEKIKPDTCSVDLPNLFVNDGLNSMADVYKRQASAEKPELAYIEIGEGFFDIGSNLSEEIIARMLGRGKHPLYTTLPAAVPIPELQAMCDSWSHNSTDERKCADELRALIDKHGKE